MKKLKTRYLIIILVGIIIGTIICWNKLQELIFFHPWNDMVAYNKLKKINEFKEVTIKNDKVDLAGWYWSINDTNNPTPLVIFFTGNAQNSSNTMYKYYSSSNMKEVLGDYNLMIIDYPGYGFSKGKPSDDNMFIASKYVFEYATNMPEVDKENIVIMGYSIGTGVASYCASQNEANGLILIAPYDKALSLYNDKIDSFHGSAESLAKYSFDSATYAENVKEKSLIFTSKGDEIINYKHALDLAGHFSELDDVIILEDTKHNDYFSESIVLDDINNFLKKIEK